MLSSSSYVIQSLENRRSNHSAGERDEPQAGMQQVGERLQFGPGNSLSVAGHRYQLEAEYTVGGTTYPISFSMVCDTIPSTLTLAYDPADHEKWDWPEDRTLETD